MDASADTIPGRGTSVSDLIDRQAALDALADAMPSLTTPDGCGQFDHDIQVTDEAYVDCMRIIHDLPSVQSGCEDAVSRFEVLRLIDYSSHDLNDAVDNRYMQNEIKQLPSVTPKQPGWIPCTPETMPQESGEYLVTIKWDEGDYDVDIYEYDAYYKEWNDGELYCEKVMAWQLLPTPYREGGQE